MKSENRLTYLDMAKGFGILLVVLGHLEYISHPVRVWLVSFHMPLFFFISGILVRYKKEDKTDWGILVKKKCRSILLPYACFSLCYLLIDIMCLLLFDDKMTGTLLLSHLTDSVTFYGVSVLWFLVAAFVGELLFLFLIKHLSFRMITLAAVLSVLFVYGISLHLPTWEAALLSCLPALTAMHVGVSLFRGMMAFAFLTAGYGLSSFITKEQGFSASQLWTGIFLSAITVFLSQINGGVDLRFLIFHNILLYVVCAITGTIGVIFICKNIKPLKAAAYYGRNSLIVMVTHLDFYLMYLAVVIAFALDRYVTRAKLYIFCLCVIIVVFSAEFIIIELVNRYFYFMLGRKRPAAGMKNEKGTI